MPNDGSYSLPESIFDDSASPAAAPLEAAPAPTEPVAPPIAPPPIPTVPPPPAVVSRFPGFKDRLRRTRERFKTNIGAFVALAVFSVACIGIVTFVPLYFRSLTAVIGGAILAGLVGFALSLVTPYIAIAAAKGEPAGKAFAHGFKKMLPGTFTMIVAYCAVVLPMLLIVPGLIMTIRTGLAIFVTFNEGLTGSRAMARSRQLMYGRGVTLIFEQIGLVLMYVLLYAGLGLVVGLIANGFPENTRGIVTGVITGLVNSLTWPFFFIFMQVFYEDCVALVGNTEPDVQRAKHYRILAILGLLLGGFLLAAPIVLIVKNAADLPWNRMIDSGGNVNVGNGGDGAVDPGNDGASVAGAATPSSRDVARIGHMNTLRNALALYFKDNKNYPETLASLEPTHLEKVPVDPSTGEGYAYAKGDLTYRIEFSLEQGVLVYAAGKHVMTPQGYDVEALPTPVPPDEVTNTGNVPTDGTQPTPAPTPTPPAQADADGDKLADVDEQSLGSDPAKPDTDGDKFSDGYEVYVSKTDPKKADTDGDGFDDFSEVQNGYEPTGPGPLTDERKTQIESDRARFDAR